jgi:hypothetical protein
MALKGAYSVLLPAILGKNMKSLSQKGSFLQKPIVSLPHNQNRFLNRGIL